MSRSNRRRPTRHDYRIGELVVLSVPVRPLPPGEVVQVVGFRGSLLRLLPIGGIPVLAHFELIERAGLPPGSQRPPHRRRRRRPSNEGAKAEARTADAAAAPAPAVPQGVDPSYLAATG